MPATRWRSGFATTDAARAAGPSSRRRCTTRSPRSATARWCESSTSRAGPSPSKLLGVPLQLRLERGQAGSPPGLHLRGGVGIRQSLVRERHPALRLTEVVEADDHPGRAVLPVVAGASRGPGRAHAQLRSRQPAFAQLLVREGFEEPLDRYGDGPRGTYSEAVRPLAGHPQAPRPLVADGNRLRVPALDALLLPEPARDLRMRAARRLPTVEQLEPCLPAAPGRGHDPLLRNRRLELGALRAVSLRDQHPPGRGVALARLGHSLAHAALERLLPRHVGSLLCGGRRRDPRSRCPAGRGDNDRRPDGSWPPLPPRGRRRGRGYGGLARDRAC